MTDKHLAKQVRISVPTLQRLEQLQHPGQSVDGVITELLDALEREGNGTQPTSATQLPSGERNHPVTPLPKAPEPQKPPEKGYEAPPNTAVQTFVSEVKNETH